MGIFELPKDYNEIKRVDLQKNIKLAVLINVAALVIAILLVPIGLIIAPISLETFTGNPFELLISLVLLLIGMILYLLCHELTHGIFIKKYSGRAPIIHMKDINTNIDLNDMDNNLVELGAGDVDFESIVRWGENNGVEYYCIEQDSSKIGMFESLKIALDNLTKIFENLK